MWCSFQELFSKEKNIAVGCVPTAAVASTPGGGCILPTWFSRLPVYPSPSSGYTLLSPVYTLPPGMPYLQKGPGTRDTLPPPWKRPGTRDTIHTPNRMTDPCENITFPQLRWLSLNMYAPFIDCEVNDFS